MEVTEQTGVPAGWSVVAAPPPSAPMSPRAEANASVNPPSAETVTVGDFAKDPLYAANRVIENLKKQAADPKTWLTIAAGVLAPKVFNAAAPVIARAASAAMSSVNPDLVSIASPRAGAALKIAQRIQAVRQATTPAAAPLETPPASAPSVVPSAPPSASAPPAITPQAPPPDVLQRLSPATAESVAPTALASMPGALTDAEVQAVEALVKQGYDRDQVLTQLAQQKANPSSAPAPAVPKLTAAEVLEVQKMIRSGKATGLADAIQKMQAAKELAARLGLASPTVAQTKFPKGMRGGTQPLTPLP